MTDAAPTPPDPADAVPARLRRAPRYRPFIVTGALTGILLALLLSYAVPVSGGQSRGPALAYLLILFGPLGGVLGGGLALVLERRRR